jgi:hypothetical protein
MISGSNGGEDCIAQKAALHKDGQDIAIVVCVPPDRHRAFHDDNLFA